MHRWVVLLVTLLSLSGRAKTQGGNSTNQTTDGNITLTTPGDGGGGDGFCAAQSDGYYCADCLHAVYCSANTTIVIADCGQNQGCEEITGFAYCTDLSSSSCNCNSNQCDEYDPSFVDMCNGDNGIYDIVACPGTCTSGACSEPGTTTINPSCDYPDAKVPGWNVITPDCQKAFYCNSDGVQTAENVCDPGQYADDMGNCQTAPPQPCASCNEVCPDLTDCQKYHFCSGGISVTVVDCPDGTYFNPNAVPPMCSGTNSSVCDPLTKCVFGTTTTSAGGSTTTTAGGTTTTPTGGTTTTPIGGTTATSPGGTTTTSPGGTTTTPVVPTTPPECNEETAGNYPYGSCSPYYWSCRKIGGDWQFVQLECSSGQVFNPSPNYPYCDDPDNVPTCA